MQEPGKAATRTRCVLARSHITSAERAEAAAELAACVVSALAAAKGIALAIIPGDGRADPRLDAESNLPPSTLRRLKTLCDDGGSDSARAALAQLALAAGRRQRPHVLHPEIGRDRVDPPWP